MVYHKIDAPFMRDPKGKMLMGQWCRPEFEYLARNGWEFTEKVDGTNIRIEIHRNEDYLHIDVKGRTDNAQIPKPLVEALNEIFGGEGENIMIWPGMEKRSKTSDRIGKIMLDRDITDLVIYGEGYGPRINGGGKYADTPSFVVFDIKVGDFYLHRESVNGFCDTVGLDKVPVVGVGSLRDGFKIVRDGLTSQWGDFEAEGIVAVPTVPLFNRAGNRIITKIKSKDFR